MITEAKNQGDFPKDPEEIKRKLIDELQINFVEIDPPPIPDLNLEYIGSQEAQDFFNDIAIALRRFVELPIITDRFASDHNARHAFQKELSGKSHQAWEIYANDLGGIRNKLVGGQSFAALDPLKSRVRLFVSSPAKSVAVPKNKLNLLGEWADEKFEDLRSYRRMDNNSKVEFARKIEAWALKFFEILAKH